MTLAYQTYPPLSLICSTPAAAPSQRTMRNDGFTLDGIERNSRGGVSTPSLRKAVARFFGLGEPPGNYLARCITAIDVASRARGYGPLQLQASSYSGQFTTEDMRGIAAVLGYSVLDLWPYASLHTREEHVAAYRKVRDDRDPERCVLTPSASVASTGATEEPRFSLDELRAALASIPLIWPIDHMLFQQIVGALAVSRKNPGQEQ